tara:strand:+ start:9653 stop:10000 length:348 start_codon:yes stop_codon:yes gene_type:complete
MAIQAGEYNFKVTRRSDHTEVIELTDGNDQPINLTGFTVAAQVWEKTRTTKFADFAVQFINQSQGSFKLKLTKAQTSTFTPNELNYDVVLRNPSNEDEYYIRGIIYVIQGYSTIS